MSVPIRSAGSKIGRELQTLETGLNGRRQRFDGERLGQAGHAFEQDVTVGEQAEEQPIDEIFLPDHDVADLFAQRRNPLAQLLHLVRDFLRRFHRNGETNRQRPRSIFHLRAWPRGQQ